MGFLFFGRDIVDLLKVKMASIQQHIVRKVNALRILKK
jgi:hypothetical protein